MASLIDGLEESTHYPIHDDGTIPVPRAEKAVPMKMIFDTSKPLQNAPEGSVKTTFKSDLIPMAGEPIPSDPSNVELGCKNGDTNCKRIPSFVKDKENLLAEVDR